MTARYLGCSIAMVLAAASGCGGGGETGTGGSSTTTTTASGPCGVPVDTAGCDTVLAPGSDDAKAALTALIEVKSGGSVCFCPGNFSFDKQLSLTVPNVTVKGLGASPGDTILDFAANVGASGGSDTMLVTADGFTIENLSIKNTPGNGIVVRQADKPTFRKLKVSWDSPLAATHGAYAVYPAECTDVLIEDCEVSGASDAAIYVGQGTGAIVRRNKAFGSVLGIELENTTNGEVYDNEAYGNSGGIAVFLLGNLTKKTAEKNLIRDNDIHDNNLTNFGDPKTFVASVPSGTGIIVLAADDTEIRNNKIQNNQSAGVLVVDYQLMVALVPGAKIDPMTDPDPEGTFIHDNTYVGNGQKPGGPLSLIGVPQLEDVLWDGIAKSGDPASNDAKFCLGTKAPHPPFRMFAGDHLGDPDMGVSKQSTDTTPYQCDLPALPSSAP